MSNDLHENCANSAISRINAGERSGSLVKYLIEKEYLSGYLKKWSPVIGCGWQLRFFCLLEKDNTLVYWGEKPTFKDEQPLGSINLRIVENVYADGPLCITLCTPRRDYQLKASSPAEKDKWIDALVLWTLRSRTLRCKTEELKKCRFTCMLIDATQSCFDYVFESFFKPFKKSPARSQGVGPETFSVTNKKKFLADRGLFDALKRAWDLTNERRSFSTICHKNIMKSIASVSTVTDEKDINGKSKFVLGDIDFFNSGVSTDVESPNKNSLSLKGSKGSIYSISDSNCPFDVNVEDENFPQHRYSIQLIDLMRTQLANTTEPFLNNVMFGLVYIQQPGRIINRKVLKTYWGLLISSRTLSEAHHTIPSDVLGPQTLFGPLSNYKKLQQYRRPMEPDPKAIRGLISKNYDHYMKIKEDGRDVKSNYQHGIGKESISSSISSLSHFSHTSTYHVRRLPYDPYSWKLDKLYLFNPTHDILEPIQMLDLENVIAISNVEETIKGFCFTLTLKCIPDEKTNIEKRKISQELLQAKYSYTTADFIDSTFETELNETDKSVIEIVFCVRSLRDAKAWRYGILVSRKASLLAEKAE